MTRKEYMNICMMSMFGVKLAMIGLENYSFVESALRVTMTILIAYFFAGIFEKMED